MVEEGTALQWEGPWRDGDVGLSTLRYERVQKIPLLYTIGYWTREMQHGGRTLSFRSQ